ncbi:hypothetical protein GCM10023185_41280 [Hymenobacter saemangeumensis]|uniref:Lipid/polyisoprenoid-binding YceI-like domain-containing protein n=1 Tax=Hymenobacter saemangeumensis TaxID=1084522 RepID=A0ABP8IRA9_9BACT
MRLSYLLLIPVLLLAALGQTQAQGRYMTKTGRVSFFSESLIENIEAHNQHTAAMLDLAAGQLAFSVPIKEFVFKRTLMQEHFNENYLESDKYPKATFSGKFVGLDPESLTTPGPHAVQVEGDLSIHGVTRRIQVPGTLEIKNNQLVAAATFPVATADYNIKIPALVRSQVAKVVSVRVALTCDPAPAAPATARPTN